MPVGPGGHGGRPAGGAGASRGYETSAVAELPERRRPTLVARASGQREGATLYRFDIHLQGENETVFFEL